MDVRFGIIFVADEQALFFNSQNKNNVYQSKYTKMKMNPFQQKPVKGSFVLPKSFVPGVNEVIM